MMKEEMELMGPVKMKDVHAAQQRIVEIVRKLEEEGIISLAGRRRRRICLLGSFGRPDEREGQPLRKCHRRSRP